MLYGNGEYELEGNVAPGDRLSRLFVNARVNLSRYADLTASYSSGRGMDYHQFLLELSQNPSFQNSEIERFFYNTTYGAALQLHPPERSSASTFPARRAGSRTWAFKTIPRGFGFSAGDILHSGVTLYGNYNLNRGDSSEADTFYLSAARNFGKVAVNVSFANFFNGVRFAVRRHASGRPHRAARPADLFRRSLLLLEPHPGPVPGLFLPAPGGRFRSPVFCQVDGKEMNAIP